jgi:outer membrane protein assembly factor BamD (BamD/ComL family)
MAPIAQRDQQFTRQAELVCRNVALDYAQRDPDVGARAQELANLARNRLAEKEYENGAYYASREWYDSAIIYYQVVFDDYGDTAWAPRAILGIIEAYREIGYDDEVEEWRRTLLNSYPDSPEARSIVNGDSGDRSPLP